TGSTVFTFSGFSRNRRSGANNQTSSHELRGFQPILFSLETGSGFHKGVQRGRSRRSSFTGSFCRKGIRSRTPATDVRQRRCLVTCLGGQGECNRLFDQGLAKEPVATRSSEAGQATSP